MLCLLSSFVDMYAHRYTETSEACPTSRTPPERLLVIFLGSAQLSRHKMFLSFLPHLLGFLGKSSLITKNFTSLPSNPQHHPPGEILLESYAYQILKNTHKLIPGMEGISLPCSLMRTFFSEDKLWEFSVFSLLPCGKWKSTASFAISYSGPSYLGQVSPRTLQDFWKLEYLTF